MASKALIVMLKASVLLMGSATASPLRAHSPNPIDMPVTWTPSGFTTDILTIGTPPQKVVAFTDWTWVGQYLISPLCNGVPNPRGCLPSGQGMWNYSQSSTFVNETSTWGWSNGTTLKEINWNPNHFFFYDDLRAQIGRDVVRLGDASEAEIYVQVANMDFELPQAFPFTGVFGLSPAFRHDNVTTQSAFYQMWKGGAIPSSRTSFIYCYNNTVGISHAPPRNVCGGYDGVQTLGGVKHNNIKGRVEWHKIISYPPVNRVDFVYAPYFGEYWTIPLTSMKIGNESQALNTTLMGQAAATFDHASYGVGAPMGEAGYSKLVSLVGGKPITLSKEQRPNNGNQSDYSVDCKKVSTFPELKYSFGGSQREWIITPQNYVEKMNGTCLLNIRTLGNGSMQIGNFGKDFARDKVVQFDFEKKMIGLSDLKW